MRRKVIVLAAMAALMSGVGAPWHAQAQIERGPAALAGAAQNYTPIEKAACGPRQGPILQPVAITGSAGAIIAGARPAEATRSE